MWRQHARLGLATVVALFATLAAGAMTAGKATAAPAAPTASIPQVIAADDNLKTLVALLQSTGLDKGLAGGRYTFFAPTDAAFAKVPAATMKHLAGDPEALKELLLYHTVAGEIDAAAARNVSTLMTLDAARVGVSEVGESLYVNNAKIVGDSVADNGIVHTIDTVLMPPDPSALGSSRIGYCAVAGNTSPTGAPIRPGRFINLRAGQPAADFHYAGAAPANYIEGVGISCLVPSSGYKQEGVAPASRFVPAGTYPYWAKIG
jgi:uncharacterized surface protein with fasciclin (FAS1) repeats